MTIFFFAGEPSGDELGGKLLQELKREVKASFVGVGGEKMITQGLHPLLTIDSFSVMGVKDVLLALPKLLFYLRKIVNYILHHQIEAVILIDYAEFNILLAKKLRKKGYKGKIIHYVSPTVWAWRKKRIRSLEKNLDHLITILPFEKEYFVHTKLPVSYVGHPLVHAVENAPKHPLNLKEKTIALFPGSRKGEIALNLEVQLQAALPFLQQGFSLAISIANDRVKDTVKKIASEYGVDPLFVPSQHTYDLMRECSAALATCGTVTFELGLHEKKTVVTYRLGLLNYIMGRYLFRIRLPHFSLPNIILKREIFPEFVHRKISANEVGKALDRLMQKNHQADFSELKERLERCNASKEAARVVLQIIGNR